MTAAPEELRQRAALVGLAQSGDRHALDRLLRLLQEPLYTHIATIVRDDDLAHDVLQESLLLIARHIKSLRDPAWVKAWSWRIATRAAVRRAQGAARHNRMFPLFADGDEQIAAEEPPADRDLEAELSRLLPKLVERLPPASRIVIRMHYLDEMTFVEIAEALEIPVGTVKSRLSYGLAALRPLMREVANR